jgi:two-component system, OmpR family, response regulator AdeR
MLPPVILISDDEPFVVSALAREARRLGLASVADTTSRHVMELARRHRPAVIILDIHQHEDGRDLLARLKQDPQTRHCKVVILSGVEDQFTRHVCFELGADAYEVKPFDHTFMARVARMADTPAQPEPRRVASGA